MTPIYFGEGHALFGWVHLPAASAPGRRTGVVLCTSHGDEYLCAFRGLRTLAIRAAALGFPTIRFDYHGTGDSAGSDRDPDRVAAWRRSIHAAIDELRARSGVDTVHVVGVRLGALLGAVVAGERDDIASAVLWAPIARGRLYVRELKAFGAAAAASSPAKVDPSVRGAGDEESGGFFLGATTLAELTKLDVMEPAVLARAPAPRVLLIGRDTTPVDAKLIARFTELGAQVEVEQALGFAGMMAARDVAELPVAVLDAITRRLDALDPAEPARHAPPPITQPAPTALVTATYAEHAVQFGPAQRLFGIVTTPAGNASGAPPRPGVLLLSIGANHHVGSNGLYVRMARAWAARGVSSLRFDLAGIGDSTEYPDAIANASYPRTALDDVRAALDVLRARGVTRFTLLGLCSGAYHAFKLAVDEPTISSLLLVNPPTFAWGGDNPFHATQTRSQTGGAFRAYRRSALDPARWRKLLRGDVDVRRVARVVLARGRDLAASWLRRVRGTRPGAAPDPFAALGALCDRGVDLCMVFAADDPGLDHLKLEAGHHLAALRGRREFALVEIAGTDHAFTPLWSQLELERVVTARLDATHGR